MKFDINGLMYDICNWGLNFTLLAFVWSISHFFCIAIAGLFVLRFVAELIYRRSVMKEAAVARQKIIEMVKKQAARDGVIGLDPADLTEEEQLELEQIIEDHNNVIVDITPKDDKKVH